MLQIKSVKVEWWEPYRETRKASLQAIKQSGMLRPRRWIAMTFVAAVLFAPLLAWSVHLFPGMVIPWRALCMGPFAIPFFLLFNGVVFWLTPRFISIDQNGLLWTQGQSSTRIARDRFRCAIVCQHPDGSHWFVVEFVGKNHVLYARQFAIGRKVDLDALSALCIELLSQPEIESRIESAPERSAIDSDAADETRSQITSPAR
ncbi:MAG: hypothetical protein GC200_09135 [Tepidisphaera sp.]|nr:hypothetical protein [Tepidisphaera sp.]